MRDQGGDVQCTAWRLLDAQFWGVPQRRKRIYLVNDFGNGRAGQILFECESVLGIIRRAETRNKEIPVILKIALLERIAEEWQRTQTDK